VENETVEALVAAARRGSADARDELIRRHQRQAVLTAAALVNDATEAQDLAQEAFIRAFRNLDLLADPSRFAPWLRKIVVGVSIDWLRSFRPQLYRGWDGTDELPHASPDPSPLDVLLQSEMTARVRAALDALPPKYRVPIHLYHLDGLSHQKIADALGVPAATVRSLVARARRKLAPLLQETFMERPAAAARRLLHVANGTSTTITIEAAGIPGVTSIWADPLHDGPVPGDLDDAALMALRIEHHAESAAAADPKNDLRLWRQVIARHEAWDELVLWYEHDLFDQLILLQLLPFIRAHVPPSKPVSLICVGSFPGHPDFHGLGELQPDELASLFETRQPITDAQYQLAARGWDAFRQPTPEALDAVRLGDTSALPFLARALTRFLEEYPWVGDGLSRTERRLMTLAAEGRADWPASFRRMHEGEDAYYISDTSYEELAHTLAGCQPPLLAGNLQSLTLTPYGRKVLDGHEDRVRLCGFDRWLGGVYLRGHAVPWRWDDARGGIVRG
jgi:RNA polymerase sigma factor (sigma-70 family)